MDVVISVGYRVKSNVGTEFRKWATEKLKEYLIRGYVINQQRIEQLGQNIEVLKSGIRILSRVIVGAPFDMIRPLDKLRGVKLITSYSVSVEK